MRVEVGLIDFRHCVALGGREVFRYAGSIVCLVLLQLLLAGKIAVDNSGLVVGLGLDTGSGHGALSIRHRARAKTGAVSI